jgi:hypothetical protein
MKIETILVYCPHEGMAQSMFLNYAAETVQEILSIQSNPTSAGVQMFEEFLLTSSLWDNHTTPARYEELKLQFAPGIPALVQLARDLGWKVEFVGNIYDDEDFKPLG